MEVIRSEELPEAQDRSCLRRTIRETFNDTGGSFLISIGRKVERSRPHIIELEVREVPEIQKFLRAVDTIVLSCLFYDSQTSEDDFLLGRETLIKVFQRYPAIERQYVHGQSNDVEGGLRPCTRLLSFYAPSPDLV